MSNQRPITRIVVAGHVDHGKSTLVGRLAYETGSLSDGKDKALAAMADRRGMGFEWAFLVDAMQAERDQGVTIDTAQIWLRGIGAGGADIVMIDAPGHKEFLKNMITGAAQADGALLVIDAAEGLGEQSRRHAYLLHLLGVQKVIVAVNKMDLAGFQQDRFRAIAAEMGAYLAEIGLEALAILPVAARDGDGIAGPSPRMGWSSAPSLIAALKAVEPSRRDAALPLRLPVQDVYKLDQRRIIAGRVETGTISVGDTIIVSPSNLSTKIKSLEVWPEGGPAKTQASAGESVGLTFEDQIFVERGEVLSHSADAPLESDVFRARLFWLAKEPLTPGLRLTLKLGTYEGPCEVQSIDTVVDVGTLAHGASTSVERGGVAEATLRARRVLALDEYAHLPRTGRFVLTQNGAIAGGGIISMDGYADQRGLLTQRATNITRVGPAITRAERWQRNGHKGAVIWLTGLSGSGKSTLAVGLEPLLHARGLQTYVLDGDNLRHGLNADLGFSPAERAENIRRVGEVAALFADAGLVTLVSFISPYRSDRARARKAAGALFHEVHVRAALETCEARDPKGLYAKARAGQIRDFTGISAPYEAPDAPELVIDTDAGDVGRSLQTLMDYVLSAVRA